MASCAGSTEFKCTTGLLTKTRQHVPSPGRASRAKDWYHVSRKQQGHGGAHHHCLPNPQCCRPYPSPNLAASTIIQCATSSSSVSGRSLSVEPRYSHNCLLPAPPFRPVSGACRKPPKADALSTQGRPQPINTLFPNPIQTSSSRPCLFIPVARCSRVSSPGCATYRPLCVYGCVRSPVGVGKSDP